MRKTLLLWLTLPVLAGCASSVNKTQTPPAAVKAQEVTDKRVVVDPDLGGAARLVGVSAKAGPEGYFRVELQVQNQTASVKSFDYQFDWTDQNDASLEMPTPIIPLTLMARETTTLVSMAPTPLAKDFRVYFFPVK